MLRRGVHPYLFVLNNDGYEIERQIHGWDAKYNDIQMYDHQLMLPFLAGKACKVNHPISHLENLIDNVDSIRVDRDTYSEGAVRPDGGQGFQRT